MRVGWLFLLLLAGCERSFDDRYDDELKELQSDAAAVKVDAAKQIDAREAADAALDEDEEPAAK